MCVRVCARYQTVNCRAIRQNAIKVTTLCKLKGCCVQQYCRNTKVAACRPVSLQTRSPTETLLSEAQLMQRVLMRYLTLRA